MKRTSRHCAFYRMNTRRGWRRLHRVDAGCKPALPSAWWWRAWYCGRSPPTGCGGGRTGVSWMKTPSPTCGSSNCGFPPRRQRWPPHQVERRTLDPETPPASPPPVPREYLGAPRTWPRLQHHATVGARLRVLVRSHGLLTGRGRIPIALAAVRLVSPLAANMNAILENARIVCYSPLT